GGGEGGKGGEGEGRGKTEKRQKGSARKHPPQKAVKDHSGSRRDRGQDRDVLLAVKSPYVNELEANQTVQGTFLVAHKDVRQKKSGEPYLSLILADRTGDLEAKMWDNASEALATFERDDFVRVKGLFQIFQNRPQLVLHKIHPVADSDVDASDFFAVSARDRDEMFRELQGWIAGIVDPNLKALTEAIFSDE